MENKTKVRESGIELLKIIAVFIIVISHIIQSLTSSREGVSCTIDLNHTTTSFSLFVLALCRLLGHLGNSIFFISSAYFLISKKYTKATRIIVIALDTLVISLIYLLIYSLTNKESLTDTLVLRSCLPVLKANNWYVTIYLLFLITYPFINLLLNKISKKIHLIIVILLWIVTVFGIMIFKLGLGTNYTVWITIFTTISYFKRYQENILDNKLISIICIIVGIIGAISLNILMNYLGSHYDKFSGSLLYFNNTSNVFLILTAFGMFTLFKRLTFKSQVINYISSLTLFIYLIHENILFRVITRPMIWQLIYDNFGFSNIFIWVFIYSIVILLAATLLSTIYKETIGKFTNYLINSIGNLIKKKIKKEEIKDII